MNADLTPWLLFSNVAHIVPVSSRPLFTESIVLATITTLSLSAFRYATKMSERTTSMLRLQRRQHYFEFFESGYSYVNIVHIALLT